MNNSSIFTCKCNKVCNWVTEGKTLSPCPHCKRVYKGVYNQDKLTIEAVEVTKEKSNG